MTVPFDERTPAKRYVLLAPIASGGMATIHLGRMAAAGGFARDVAIKRLHPQYANDPDFVAMLLDEGRVAARIAHPNVVVTLDVVRTHDELFLVMEYVAGVSLSALLSAARRKNERMPFPIAAAIMGGILRGLHSAHQAADEDGSPLELVHRDISPQNVLVGTDGVPKVVDFGIAKATRRSQVTREGVLKGKVPYMAPEQLRAGTIDRRADIWAAGIVLSEMLTGERTFGGEEGQIIGEILYGSVPPPSRREGTADTLDPVVAKATARFPERRYATAKEMADELEQLVRPATASEVGAWVEFVATEELERRSSLAVEAASAPSRVLETTTKRLEATAPLPDASAKANPSDAALAVPVPPPVADRRLKTVALVLGALVAVLGAIVVVPFFRRPTEDPRPIADRATPSPAASSSSSESAEGPAPPPFVAPPLQAPPPASAVSAVPRQKPPVAPRGTSSARGARGDDKCHHLDEKGIWHIKPECL